MSKFATEFVEITVRLFVPEGSAKFDPMLEQLDGLLADKNFVADALSKKRSIRP